MMQNSTQTLSDILFEGDRAPWLPVKARGLTKKILSIDRIESIYNRISASGQDVQEFSRVALQALNITYALADADLARIPKTGPVLVVANHPFGLLEGLILCAELPRVRPDVKVMANALLGMVPQLHQTMIFVDILSGKDAARKNIRPLGEAVQWLTKKQGLMAMFPSGTVSSWDWKQGSIVDQTWNDCAARLAKKSGATVVPLYFEGNNSLPFYLAGMIHPSLRTLRMPAELANKMGTSVRMRIGCPIGPEELASIGDSGRAMEYLRARTYALGYRGKPEPAKAQKFQTAVVSATDISTMRSEVETLKPSSIVAQAGPLMVFLAKAREIPAVLTEVGRLRETTFREVGEGTGRRVDLDWFDMKYDHLILWNREKSEVAGGYRLARTTDLLKKFGKSGLYTNTLFHFKQEFFDKLGPAVELGRSFVAPAYQKQYGPLLLLWRGILAYLQMQPDHTKLFGAVSISSDFTPASRRLVVDFLHRKAKNHPLRSFVKPRNPFRVKPHFKDHLDSVSEMIDSLDGLSNVVSDLEGDQRGIPVLLRQYSKMGGVVLDFTVDAQFSNVLDGLIVVDLDKSDAAMLRRYGYKQNSI